jgi:hypothetical protein
LPIEIKSAQSNRAERAVLALFRSLQSYDLGEIL